MHAKQNKPVANAPIVLGVDLYDRALREEIPERKRRLLLDACKHFDEAAKDCDWRAAFVPDTWGEALNQLAEMEQNPEKKRTLLEEACAKFEMGRKIREKLSPVRNIYSEAIADSSNIEKGSGVSKSSLEHLEQGIALLDDQDASGWSGWGYALAQLAYIESNREKKVSLLEDTCLKCEEAIKRDESIISAWSGWGATLLMLALMTEDPEKKRKLLEDSCNKQEEVTKRDRNLDRTWNKWGAALIELSNLEQNPGTKRVLLEQAKEKLIQVERIAPGTGCYNLACNAALQGKKDDCREWLMKAEEYGTLAKASHLRKDTDLKSVWRLKWFKELLERQEQREASADAE